MVPPPPPPPPLLLLPLLQSNGHCLLLFLTICFMTSGHFLSSTIDHHHHSNRRYQQYHEQEQYHHHFPTLSTIAPAVSRLHFLPHQHVIIRRASLPQQQYSPSIKDHFTTSSPVTLIKKIDMLQIDEELKALKKKRKRLRQLREEVRELSDHLKSKRIFSKSDELFEKHKMKETHVRWRKQITTRVKAIMKRLRRLESEMKTERNFTKGRKKVAKRLPLSPVNFHTVASSPHTLPITTNENFKIKRLHSSINQSKSGESGGICFGHNDCKPGLCCHRTSSVDTNSSVITSTATTTTVSLCYQYMLKEGELCEDSCQCEARLHCFRSSNQLKGGKSMTKSNRNTQYAICKKASTSDIVNGIYLNSKDSSFHIKPPIYQH